ncbi:unnamed protein product [Oncorhynchus mykiss]|uniref:Phosphoinositide 3-kinase regulatory subunit 5 n=1 Tax=Oncorhynchus mykiss TaxID=8022 RepID=A0A060X1M9_ONCMY|nr:unnamed protein product [Oncorhynchus mykiss]
MSWWSHWLSCSLPLFCRPLTSPLTLGCCRRPVRCSTVSCPGQSPAAAPADTCSPSSSRSSGCQLSGVCHSQRDTSITLIKHAFQAALGTKYPLQILHHALQLVTAVIEALETAASTWDPDTARESPLQRLKGLVERICMPPPDCHTGPGNAHTLTLPLAKCHMYSWDKDNFGNELFPLLLSPYSRHVAAAVHQSIRPHPVSAYSDKMQGRWEPMMLKCDV